jgi:GNAT superfamily N-acetyltransferase
LRRPFRTAWEGTIIFRPAAESELARVLPLIVADPASVLTADRYAARLAAGEYRPGWTWIAEAAAGGAPLAVGVWWGHPEEPVPSALDCVCVHDSVGSAAERTALAAELLSAAHAAYAAEGATLPPDFHIFLPGDWRDRPGVVEALEWRRAAARRAGLTGSLERLRYEWTPQDGVPEPSGRLRFHAEPDDEVFVELFVRVLTGTLDATSRTEAARIGVEAQARGDLVLLRDRMSGDRSWWRIARTPDGEPVGFGIPSRNSTFPVVGYLGVLPEHRGRGHADEILGEITRILAAEAAPERIRADTDLANRPMAAAFERVGYRNHARRLVLSAR